MSSDVVVIGGGPAGVEAAVAAAPYAASVRMVAKNGPGDWDKLLPSRVWLAAVDDLSRASRSPFLSPEEITLEAVHAEVARVRLDWERQVRDRLDRTGVEVIVGSAAFRSADEITVTSHGATESLEAKTFILATGAEPVFPLGFEPDGERVFSPATMDTFTELPDSILVVGDGCIGFEFVDLFSRLGCR